MSHLSLTGSPRLLGCCSGCGYQMYEGLSHQCPTYCVPLPMPYAPQLGVGELDGECLIDMNNVAVGFARKP